MRGRGEGEGDGGGDAPGLKTRKRWNMYAWNYCKLKKNENFMVGTNWKIILTKSLKQRFLFKFNLLELQFIND